MLDKLNEHRKATIKAQKVAWKKTIRKRLCNGKEKKPIPIVIWGLEASPSYVDENGEKKIRADKLHENYLYNTADKDGHNYGVKLIKNWLNNGFDKPYSYDRLIEELSGTKSNGAEAKELVAKANAKAKSMEEGEDIKTIDKSAIHLVYDIFPEWHGVKVGSRAACYNREYMCEKIPDFRKHYKLIKSEFCLNPNKIGDIFFVWLGTKQKNNCFIVNACETFFCCLKKEFKKEIKLYYNPEGFVTKSELKAWPNCPADFSAIGVPTDWSEHIVQAGYHTVEALCNEQPIAVFKKLYGFREKESLDISILELDQVKSWF